ncbi:MAG: hypothetical protein Q4C70_14795, partial [Planctomycetia bacterium]|nr:hypothetical protein [Planctomycetia bacterium]
TEKNGKIGVETVPEAIPKVESSELLKHFSGFNTSTTENTGRASLENAGKIPTERRSLLAEVRKSFPENMTFLTGIQDFKNVPMLRLEHATKTFTAEIHGFYDITPSPNSLFRIKCDPQGTELERMRVMIRPGALLGSTWKFPRHLSGIEPVCLERQPLEQAEDVNASFELWELRFPQPQREPFEFELVLMTTESVTQDARVENGDDFNDFWHHSPTGQTVLEESAFVSDAQYSWWREHFPHGFRLPLLDVIDAQKCTGTITLRNDVTDSILAETQEMIPVLLPIEDSLEFKPENAEDCCRYSYEPHTVSNSPGPRLTLIWRERKASVKQAWIWELGCQSQFFTNGKVLHSARFNIENIDAYQLTFTLENPKKRKVDFLGILVNGQRIPAELVILPPEETENMENSAGNNALWNHSASSSVRGTKKDIIQHKYRLRIPFPLWRRQSEMVIQWLETVPSWYLCASLSPPEISVDLPVLQKNWDAWIPESYVPLKRFSVFECPPRSTLTCANHETAESENPLNNVNHVESGNLGSRFPKDTIFLRLFGTLRLGKSIFSRPESLTPGEIDSPITLDAQTIRELSTEKFFRELGTTFWAREQIPYTLVGWNECAQDGKCPIFVIYGNILESVRWFLLLFVCFLASWILAGHRIIRVLVCGISGALSMLVPIVWTPVFSGIFLGVAASYLGSSVRHHLRHAAEVGVPVIQVKKDSSSRRLMRKKVGKKTEKEKEKEIEKGIGKEIRKEKETQDFNSLTPVNTEKTVIRPRLEAEEKNGKTEELKNE